MDNFVDNLNYFVEYYFLSGRILERLIVPAIIVIVSFIAIRFFISWFFQVGARVRNLSKISKNSEQIENKINILSEKLDENTKTLANINKTLEKLYNASALSNEHLKEIKDAKLQETTPTVSYQNESKDELTNLVNDNSTKEVDGSEHTV